MGKKISSISKKTLANLESYNWPGNVRELKNVIERSMITTSGSTLKLELNHVTQLEQEELITLRDIERNHILSVLDKTFWRIGGKGGAAEILDINPNTLRSRMEKLKISKPK
jgi:DNA-binding NtrC family response regulator